MTRKIFLPILLLACTAVFAQQACPVIPLPRQAAAVNAQFLLHSGVPLLVEDTSLQQPASYLLQQLQRYNTKLRNGARNGAGAIVLNIERNGGLPPGGYRLQMDARGIHITGAAPEGVFNGVVSLLQLVAQSPRRPKGLQVPCWNITDAPAYEWRGLLLDESRHFFGKQRVKALLDWMAWYKLNRFHWHLTDVPGWRLEIKQYPLLTTVGGRGDLSDPNGPAAYYTQEDIREIVAYARERYIQIMPEIDMPGHAGAANRAYPEYSGGGSEKYPHFTFNPGKAATYGYLANILRETDALFPWPVIHLGGDEVSFGNKMWDTDTGVQRLMQAHQLKDRVAVEQYFLRRMADTVAQLHNRIAVWDEAVNAGLDTAGTIICWWRHDRPEQLQQALGKGYSVVLCPRIPLYLDFVQDSAHRVGRRWKKGEFSDLEQLYRFGPATYGVPRHRQGQLLGMQGCVWTEVIGSGRRLDFMVFPRICALAEAAWTEPGQRDYAQFRNRLKAQLPLFDRAGIYYYDPFAPRRHPEVGSNGKITEASYID